jgi:hypothetical protein
MGTFRFSMVEGRRRERDVVPRTRRTTSFLMVCEFWEHESLKHMRTSGED